jgi:hypothetical protein
MLLSQHTRRAESGLFGVPFAEKARLAIANCPELAIHIIED